MLEGAGHRHSNGRATRTIGAVRIGLGLAALGRPGYLTLGHGDDLGPNRSVRALERRAHTVLDVAHDAGVRHFDAARSYGETQISRFRHGFMLIRMVIYAFFRMKAL